MKCDECKYKDSYGCCVATSQMMVDIGCIEKQMLYAIVGFKVPEHKSLLYRQFLTKKQLLNALSTALDKGATVVSIREVIR